MLKKPMAGWSSIVLVTLMLLCVAWALESETLRVAGLEVLTFVVLGGVITGVVLASLEWLPATLAHGWSLVIGIVGASFVSTFALHHYADASVLENLGRIERMGVVRTWFFTWLRDVTSGGFPDATMSSFVFVVAMSLLLWLISYVCVWFVVRYVSWWGAVLPSGFALLVALYNGSQRQVIYLVFFLFCALLLAARTYLALQEHSWRAQGIGFSSDMRFDVLRDGLVVALVVIAFGWLAPTDLGAAPLQGALSRLASANSQMNAQLSRWFPSIRLPARGGGSSFGNELPLGGSISLNQNPVFDARIEGSPVPRYFRMAVFDRYDGLTWHRQPSAIRDGEAGALDLAEDYALTVPVTQTIEPFLPVVTQLYAAPQPERFSIPVRAAVADGPPAGDVLTVESRAPLAAGESAYAVVSRVSDADVDSLRNAGDADPEWVRERYLEVPDSVPQRVLDLADQIAQESGAANRFDAATAIETYLRQIPYSERISPPPAGQDRVDWFLFDEQRGYCDYYASSFVVLARAAGLPARFVAGYSLAANPEADGDWRMRNSDAHTWPEVYFPDYGWIEFEPTAADGQIERPQLMANGEATPTPRATLGGPNQDPTPESQDDFLNPDRPTGGAAPPTASGVDWGRIALWLGGLLALCTGVAAALAFAWQRPLRGLSMAERAFAQFVRLAGLAGLRPRAVETPFEYGRRVAGAIPEASGEISTITDAFVRERFAHRSQPDDASSLARAWQRLRAVLVRQGTRLRWLALRRRP